MVLECNRDASLMLDIIASTIKVNTREQMVEVIAVLCGLLPQNPVELDPGVRPKLSLGPCNVCSPLPPFLKEKEAERSASKQVSDSCVYVQWTSVL